MNNKELQLNFYNIINSLEIYVKSKKEFKVFDSAKIVKFPNFTPNIIYSSMGGKNAKVEPIKNIGQIPYIEFFEENFKKNKYVFLCGTIKISMKGSDPFILLGFPGTERIVYFGIGNYNSINAFSKFIYLENNRPLYLKKGLFVLGKDYKGIQYYPHHQITNSQRVFHPKLTEILESVDSYFKSNQHYGLYNMLLFGPPGTGKSSILRLLIEKHQKKRIIVTINDDYSLSYMLAAHLELCHQKKISTIVIIEEIDTYFTDEKNNVKYLLNILDGFSNKISKGALIIMTTNRPNLLESRNIRPMRIDEIYHIGPLEKSFTVKLLNDTIKKEGILKNRNDLEETLAGFTGAEIKKLAYQYLKKYHTKEKFIIEDFIKILQEVKKDYQDLRKLYVDQHDYKIYNNSSSLGY